MLDVVVVGAGPAGLYSALLLAAEGLDVAVLEEHATVGEPTHCTGIISDEVSDLFKVSEGLVLNRPTACLVRSSTGRAFPFASDGEGIAVIDRGEFDRDLAAAARRTGVEIRTGFRVDRLRSDRRHVEVEGAAGVVRARACVLACGVAYGLARQLDLELPPLLLHSAQVEVDASETSEMVELHLGREIAPEGFAWTVPVARGEQPRIKVGLVSRGDARQRLQRFLDRPDISRRLVSSPELPIRRLLPLGPARRTYADRVLLVGDAAGLTKPTTGGGIFYSLLSGQLGAETLIGALRRDRLDATALRVYEGRWRARLGPDLWISSCVRRLFARLSDRQIEMLLAGLGSEEVQALIRRTARFNWHGELIRALLARPGVKATLFQAFLR